jgi:hypothetical protein
MPNSLYTSKNGIADDTWKEITFIDHGISFQTNYIVLECSVNPLLVEFSYDGKNFKDTIEVSPLFAKFPYFYCARKVRYRNRNLLSPSTFQITGVGG